MEVESVLLGRWADMRWLSEESRVGRVRTEAAVTPRMSSMEEQSRVSGMESSVP